MSFNLLLFILFLTSVFAENMNLNKNSCYKYQNYPDYAFQDNCYVNPSVLSDTPNLIKINGYKSEAHDVTTEDGYIIRIFRVYKSSPEGQPVYIQHGIATDSSGWVQNGKDSLAFFLVEKGYDVWLGNTRTTQYGKRHINLTVQNPKYWNFTLDDLAKYDMRDNFKYISTITGAPIIYIGHSMGSTMVLMYASEYPSENLLKGIVALSPVVYFQESPKLLAIVTLLYNFANIAKSLKIDSVFTNTQLTKQTWQATCRYNPNFCLEVVNKSLGPSNLFLPEQLTTYYSYFPDTIAINQILHYLSLAMSGRFEKFDYGDGNNEIYGQNIPPLYDLSKITLPTFLFYGENDALVKKTKVEQIFNELGSDIKDAQVVPINNTVVEDQFGHIEFLIGANVTELFYNDLYKYLQRF